MWTEVMRMSKEDIEAKIKEVHTKMEAEEDGRNRSKGA